MTKHTLTPIINIQPSNRRGGSGGIGKFASIGTTTAVTLDVENPWIFSSFMVSTAGNVVIQDTAGNNMLFPGCLVGTQYWAVGIKVVASGTTATGIFVYGGV